MFRRAMYPSRRKRQFLACLVVVLVAVTAPAASISAASGDLDPTFGVLTSGTNYSEILDPNDADRIYALALQTDGMIVAAGEAGGHVASPATTVNGVLRLDGVPVTLGQEIEAGEAVISRLVFTPLFAGPKVWSFSWNGFDGIVYAAQDALMTITLSGTLPGGQLRLPFVIK